MSFVVTPVTTDIEDAILAWCGVTSPTPAQVVCANLASNAAVDTIRHYRGLDVAKAWVAETAYVVGDVRQPTTANGHLYRCTTAGTSAATEPTWSTSTGGATTDGTVTWTEYTRPFEDKYTSLAIEMGVYLYSKQGVDGTTAFSENGVSRSFEVGSFPPSMLSRITLATTTG